MMDDNAFLLDQITDLHDPLQHALALQHKAAEVGFDWSEIDGVIAKISEELNELTAEIHAGSVKQKLQDELGDLLFACCNMARHLNLDPAIALQHTNQKFYRRFNYVETCVRATSKQFSDFSLAELDILWD